MLNDPLLLSFVIFAICFSAFIKGALGLGFSTICLAILANAIPLKDAIAIVLIPSLLSNIQVMIGAGNFRISVKTFWPMLLTAIVGMMVGLQFLLSADTRISVATLGVILIIYGFWGYFNQTFRIRDESIPRLNPIVGFLTGIVNGATGSQIFPIMPYLLSLNISKEVLVQTINLSFTICSLIMMATMWNVGVLNASLALSYSAAIVPVVIFVWLGAKLRARFSESLFRRLAMLLVIVLGIGLVMKVLKQ